MIKFNTLKSIKRNELVTMFVAFGTMILLILLPVSLFAGEHQPPHPPSPARPNDFLPHLPPFNSSDTNEIYLLELEQLINEAKANSPSNTLNPFIY